MIAAIAVVFALALLVVGGMALVNAVTGSPDKQGPSSAASSPSGQSASSPTASPTAQAPSASVPLLIKVTGPATTVIVRVPDTGRVLTQGVHNTGEVLQFKENTLDVVATNGGSLQVAIYGKLQPAKPANQRATWFVRPKG
ncbi:gliding motility ABC transporter auxiliary protein [Actinomadura verrucosospora]|uniref:Gliding motility ABC transporter auxiliary protein n=2 Tax=Actinomadura verrucosospora TaxID=46165 RepID=A0A7D3VUI8_ACTVE|nr:gliding motility ABC transporter auxiliary protein [Actinomadura verrucosospora]